jgi:hypothetical protein
MGAARHLLLLVGAVPSLVSARLARQVTTLLNAHVAGQEGKELDLRDQKQLPSSLATVQDGPARDKPPHISGT